jgi:hypothetical protein
MTTGIIYYIHILVHHVVLPTLYWTQTKLTQVTPPREATPSSPPRPPHPPPRPIRLISSELADGWLLVGRGECSYQKEKKIRKKRLAASGEGSTPTRNSQK